MIEVELNEGRKRKFKTQPEVVAFLKAERETWSWENEIRNWGNVGISPAQIRQDLDQQLQRAESLEDSRVILENHYWKKRDLISSHSPAGKFLNHLRSIDGSLAALALFCWTGEEVTREAISSRDPQVPRIFTMLGRVLRANVEWSRAGQEAQIYSAKEKAGEIVGDLSNLRDGIRESLLETNRQAEEQMARMGQLNQQASNDVRGYLESLKTEVEKSILERARSFDEKILHFETRLAEREEFYKQKISYEAPVAYWESAGVNSTKLAGIFGGAFLVLALVLFGSVIYNFSDIATVIGEHGPAAALLLLASVVVWLLRLISRMFLSHAHFAQDAQERVTMAKTYLALLDKGKIEADREAIILAALFRPSTTGLVKDDSANDFSPAAWLSKEK